MLVIFKEMKIVALTKFKHGLMWQALEELGWNQTDLAKRCGWDPNVICRIINLKFRPTEAQANTIQKAFMDAGKFIDVLEWWPKGFHGMESNSIAQFADVEPSQLLGMREELCEIYVDEKTMKEVLSTLSPDEQRVISGRFYRGLTLEALAKEMGGITRERVRQIEANALKRLRHPARQILMFDHSDIQPEILLNNHKHGRNHEEEKELQPHRCIHFRDSSQENGL